MTSRRLMATDLDGTFIGDDDAMVNLWEQLQAKDIIVAFSTGRHLESIERFYAEKCLGQRADVCVCMVGTDIYFREGGIYQLDKKWHEIIAEDWDVNAINALLDSMSEVTMQDAEWQSSFKRSYYLEENVEQRLAEIDQQLEKQGLRAKVVYSAGRFLDLLPIRSGKGEAVKYVAQKLAITPENVVTCGDTGNDLDMMRAELGVRGIAVGNAAEELKQFQAPHVYHANAFHAAGITEGLQVYGWL